MLVNAVLETATRRAPRADPDRGVRRDPPARPTSASCCVAKQRAEESEERAQALARTLQSTLIPPSPPSLPGLDVSAAYRPAGDGEEVGGDFYDIFQIAPGDWVVAIGDVCGKGVEAAVVTALVRYSLRALSVQQDLPSAVLHALNDILVAQGTDRFCTVVLVRLRLDEDGWLATFASGGHPLPLHVSSTGTVRPVGQSRLAHRGAAHHHRRGQRGAAGPGRRARDVHRRGDRGPARRRVLRRRAAAGRRSPRTARPPGPPRGSSARSWTSRTAPPATTSRWSRSGCPATVRPTAVVHRRPTPNGVTP